MFKKNKNKNYTKKEIKLIMKFTFKSQNHTLKSFLYNLYENLQ